MVSAVQAPAALRHDGMRPFFGQVRP